MDGHFVPVISFGPDVVKAIRPVSQKIFDVHLMIAPVDSASRSLPPRPAPTSSPSMSKAGPHLHRSLQAIRALGKKAGVTMNPGTPVESIEPRDRSGRPGAGDVGQSGLGRPEVHSAAEDKIRRVVALAGGRPIDIEVDGGVTADNAALVTRAGANALVAVRPSSRVGRPPTAQYRRDPQRRGAGPWRSGLIAIISFLTSSNGMQRIGHGRFDRRQMD